MTLAKIPEIDTRLTYAYLRYAADLLGWSGNPKAIYSNVGTVDQQDGPRGSNWPRRCRRTRCATRFRSSRRHITQYKGLQTALEHERQNPTGHLDQIRMNLERWRWMPRELGDRYVFVNVPAYQMQVMEGRQARPRHARHRRRSDASDAALQRRDDDRRVQPDLERARKHHPQGNASEAGQRSGLPRAAGHPGRWNVRRRGRCGGRRLG